jgi:subtilisin family serine protease
MTFAKHAGLGTKLALLLMTGLFSSVGAAAAVGAERLDSATPNRVMVMLKLAPVHYRGGSDYGSRYGDALGEAARRRVAREIARDHQLELDETWPMRLVGVDCVVLRVPDGRSIDQVVLELSKVPGVAWSQAVNEFSSQASRSGSLSYNDRLYLAQPARVLWHLTALHRMATGRGQTIAVIDSGVDSGHPDLAGQVSSQDDFVTPRTRTAERHGTGVAGIIAARASNAKGIVGVAPDARIMALRACWERPSKEAPARSDTVCDSLSLAKALVYAIEHRAGVINLSLSGPHDRLIQSLVETSLSRGTTVVAAIDQSRPDASFPALIPGVVAVDDERLSAKARGAYIAPGLDVPTTEPGGRWSLVNGTSFAAAHVSGLAALLRQLSQSDHIGGIGRGFGTPGTIDACALVAFGAHRSERNCH